MTDPDPDPDGSVPPPAIADYGLLSDCHAPALVSLDGSVDWWCPRAPTHPRSSRGCSTRTPVTGR
jgi:hypothetical protein